MRRVLPILLLCVLPDRLAPVHADAGVHEPGHARLADSGCPASTMNLGMCITSSTAVAFDTTCGLPGLSPWARGYFDLAADTLGVSADSPFGGSSASVRIAGRYRLVGPAAGTPVGFTLRMPVVARLYARAEDISTSASGNATLEVDGVVLAGASESHSCSWYSCTSSGNLTTTLVADVEMPAEQEFVVVTALAASVGGNITTPGSASLRARLQFMDLHPGVTAVSCHGDTFGVVGVADAAAAAALRLRSVGPNPSRGPIRVAFDAAPRRPVVVRLLDVAGRTVETAMLEAPPDGRATVTLGARGTLAPGVYFVHAAQGVRTDSRAVVIVR